MIISRTPLRMSLVGGGSDLPAFYQREEIGAVVSSAIDKYIYVTVNKKFDDGIRVGYSINEEVSTVAEIKHPLVKAGMQYLGLKGGVEITTIADIPSKGTGLGSSSSFTVGLLHALSAYMGKYSSAEVLGRDACHIEIDLCKEPIGKQDQYAAAYGGFNLIEFRPDESVIVSPLICKASTLQSLQSSLLMFYTGTTRNASSILKEQSESLANNQGKLDSLKRMVRLAYNLRDELQANNLEAFGEILHENWMLKKSLVTNISSQEIDQWYDIALTAGAKGGKILGAGAGGFLLLVAPPEKHDAIKKALSNLRAIPIGLDPLGSRIIFYT